MKRVMYRVGRDGYFTWCNTLKSAKETQARDPKFTIEVVVENVPKDKAKLTPKRAAMLDKFGFVAPKFRNEI